MSNEEKYKSLFEISALARELMEKHGVGDWDFAFDNAKRRVGFCSHREKTISLSKSIAISCTKELVKKTILHEIAHALVGRGHGHDFVWQRKCLEIGGDGKRLADANEIDFSNIKFAYKGVCPNGHISYRSRRPGRTSSCGKCCSYFNKDYIIVWEKQ